MYSCFNLIINEIKSIGSTKLGDADIVRKIISVLPQNKYATINTILHEMEDLSKMNLGLVIEKLVAYEVTEVGSRKSHFIKQRRSSHM
jgi:hypothetical protein